MRSSLVAVVFVLSCGVASAQFTVPEERPQPSMTQADTMRRLPALRSEFNSPARARAERRKMRKERNTIEFNSTLQLSQTQFENWSTGGDNTFSTRATVLFRHQHKRKKLGIDYKFEARYGINHIDKKTFKNEDQFKVNFSMTWDIANNWSYSGVTNLRSQFTNGRRSRTDKTIVNKFMAPGFFDVSVGFTYKKSPWNIVISPIGGSATFVLDEELSEKGMNGVPKGERQKWQVGPSVKINFDKTFAKIIRVRSEAYAFTNIKTAPNVRWETTVDIKPTKFLTTTLYSNLVYDKAANTVKKDHIQYKYSLSIGLAYNFKSK